MKRVTGIIPAYAGNTISLRSTKPGFRDHPRVCGEHICAFYRDRYIPGSSPRMRGTLPRVGVIIKSFGIIPAYAGNTKDYRKHAPHVRDHPRVCGEHYACQ